METKGNKQDWHATVRFPSSKRNELKVMAASRGLTMEDALLAAFEQWRDGPARPGKGNGFARRVSALAMQVHDRGDERRVEATLCVLEALSR